VVEWHSRNQKIRRFDHDDTSRTVKQQEALTLICARGLLVRLRTAAVNAVRDLTKSCGSRMPASATQCFAQRGLSVMPSGLAQALGPAPTDRRETTRIKQYDRQIQQRQWGLHLAPRDGKQAKSKAVIGLARKLAILLHRIWVTQEPYAPFYVEAA
jgi:transposase